MDDFDKFVQEARSPYGRYIDDCICILPPDRVSQFFIRANAWHPSITVEQAAMGRSNVPYLDIAISLSSANQFTFELYRKPMNLYQYLPRASCHRPSVFASLIKGEAIRIMRRCSSCRVAQKHLSIFKSHLIKRGYSSLEIDVAFDRAHLIQSVPIRHNSATVRKVFLKVRHSAL